MFVKMTPNVCHTALLIMLDAAVRFLSGTLPWVDQCFS